MDVTVDDVVGAVLLKRGVKISRIATRVSMIQTRYDAAAQSKDFVVVRARFVGMNEEVHRKALEVEMA